ncbi:hypothetical protein [Arenimonas sp. MALMAid1274]|uniref:hypothetical protein n=1 Tax=Arenimonas sp. MALMAid1274 TaxID=3411630 RepID=UPI003BA28965
MAARSHHYLVHGLEIASDLELPELAAGRDAPPDVEIVAGATPRELTQVTGRGPQWQAAQGEFLFHVEGVARYHATGGRRIVVQVDDEAKDKPADVRLYLLGTALGAVLHQRGLLALHASAVLAPDGAWAFTGHSGAGKSTLAAWLQQREGWELLSDDVSVVVADRGQALIRRGPPRVKLWRDALEAMAIGPEGLSRDLMRFDKFHLGKPALTSAQEAPLRALVLIEATEHGPQIEAMRGREALAAVMASVYRPEMADWLRPRGALFLQCAELARCIEVYRFRRPRSLEGFDDALAPLLARVAEG